MYSRSHRKAHGLTTDFFPGPCVTGTAAQGGWWGPSGASGPWKGGLWGRTFEAHIPTVASTTLPSPSCGWPSLDQEMEGGPHYGPLPPPASLRSSVDQVIAGQVFSDLSDQRPWPNC